MIIWKEEIYVSWGNDLKNRERFLESVFMHTCYDFFKKAYSSVSIAPPSFQNRGTQRNKNSRLHFLTLTPCSHNLEIHCCKFFLLIPSWVFCFCFLGFVFLPI